MNACSKAENWPSALTLLPGSFLKHGFSSKMAIDDGSFCFINSVDGQNLANYLTRYLKNRIEDTYQLGDSLYFSIK